MSLMPARYADIKANSKNSDNMSEKDKVLDAFRKAGKPLRPGDVAKMTGIESKEASKIIKELKREGNIVSPKRCYYSLTE